MRQKIKFSSHWRAAMTPSMQAPSQWPIIQEWMWLNRTSIEHRSDVDSTWSVSPVTMSDGREITGALPHGGNDSDQTDKTDDTDAATDRRQDRIYELCGFAQNFLFFLSDSETRNICAAGLTVCDAAGAQHSRHTRWMQQERGCNERCKFFIRVCLVSCLRRWQIRYWMPLETCNWMQ